MSNVLWSVKYNNEILNMACILPRFVVNINVKRIDCEPSSRRRLIMKCPACGAIEDRVIDSRLAKESTAIRRRRECLSCKKRFTTYETVEETLPYVIKKDGRRETFDKKKIIEGMRRACQKRPVSMEQLESVADSIEQELLEKVEKEVKVSYIGERAMDKVQPKHDKAAIDQPSLPPTSAVVAETAKRKDLALIKCWNKTTPVIAFWKYKSLFRKELLQSCLKLLKIAEWLFQISPYPLTTWQQWLMPIFEVPAWLFASRNLLTPIQLTDLVDSVVKSDCKKTPLRGPP